jgi:hypothetical protein
MRDDSGINHSVCVYYKNEGTVNLESVTPHNWSRELPPATDRPASIEARD